MHSTPRNPETHIHRAMRLRSTGRFEEAWSCLGKASSQSLNCFDNLVEKCHLLTVQGYRNRVVKTLEPVVKAQFSELNKDQLRVFQLQLAAAEIETRGLLDGAQKLVISTWNEILEDAADWDDNISNVRCWTLLYLAYTTFLLQKYAQYTHGIESSFKVGLNARMKSAQLHLGEMGEHCTAWDMLHYRLFLLDNTRADEELSSFLQVGSTEYLSAIAVFERSKIARAQKRYREARRLLQEVRGVFSAMNLSLREQAAKLEDMLQDLDQSKPGDLSDENLAALETLAEAFKMLKSPNDESLVLTRLAIFYRETRRYPDFSRVSAQLQEVCNSIGSNLEWCHHQFGILNLAAMQGGHLAATLEGFKSLFSKAEEMQMLQLAVPCAISLCTNYQQLKDWENALLWGRKALCISETQNDIVLGSQAAKGLALAMRDRLKSTTHLSIQDFGELVSLLAKWAEIDGENGNEEDRIDKYGLLSNTEILQAARIDSVDKQEASKKCLDWLEKAERLVNLLPEQNRISNLAEIKFKSSEAFYLLGDYPTAIGYVELAKLLFTQAGEKRQATHMQNRIGQLQLLTVYESRLSAGLGVEIAAEVLNESLKNFQQVQDALLKSDFRLQLARCHIQQAWIWQSAYELGQQDALVHALGQLEAAEDIRNGVRADMAIQKDEEILTHNRTLVAQNADLYELGVKLSLLQNSSAQAWQWIQRGKARAFLDLLGLEGNENVPTMIMASAMATERGKELLNTETKLLQDCEAASPERRFPIRQRISEIRRQLISIPELYNLQLYRGAEALSLQRLPGMFGLSKDVLCVDWALVGDSIWMITVRPGHQPSAHKLAITKPEVSSWIGSNLKAEYMRQKRANERLRELDPLVTPLSELSKKDELLVFCPSSLLSALPLHALECEGMLLLERNPVVYSSSLSVLHHCLRRADNIQDLSKIAIFGNPSGDRVEAEQSSKSLGEIWHVEPLVRDAATKSAFKQKSETSSIVHYHGHAFFDSMDPLRSALKLHRPSTEALDSGDLTARELLTMKFGIALFVMIACESAQQEINAGEEPIGLLPMLLLAGVNATIGTLWKCSDAAGKLFTKVFYDVLKTQAEELLSKNDHDVIVLDVALALRQAVLDIRKQRSLPYFWALFVLHGNWKFRFSRKEIESVFRKPDT
ncbi:CHAT domain-containing protein [Cadophora sp. MPI-SDFR-AT-0126]|nr:CHAT domain-containing protein [Leotiomycetes sp. MPI-SDFR-AT-0126]